MSYEEPKTTDDARQRLKAAGVAGPWDKEPDRLAWKSAFGFHCLMIRHDTLFHWCGYVGVEPGHPLFGMGYEDASAKHDVVAHGGLTYAGVDTDRISSERAPGLWWLGFDCAHLYDLSPGMTLVRAELPQHFQNSKAYLWEGIYKTEEFVINECEDLARQFKEIGDVKWPKIRILINRLKTSFLRS